MPVAVWVPLVVQSLLTIAVAAGGVVFARRVSRWDKITADVAEIVATRPQHLGRLERAEQAISRVSDANVSMGLSQARLETDVTRMIQRQDTQDEKLDRLLEALRSQVIRDQARG